MKKRVIFHIADKQKTDVMKISETIEGINITVRDRNIDLPMEYVTILRKALEKTEKR